MNNQKSSKKPQNSKGGKRQVDAIVSRYKAVNIGDGCSWSIYDNIRKCRILNSISPNANYNGEVIKEVVHLLNKYGG